jgi:AcrR family transcriptional regulator
MVSVHNDQTRGPPPCRAVIGMEVTTVDYSFDWQSPSARVVLEAVLDILAEVGYDGLTAKEVVARAGPAGRALEQCGDLDALVSAALSRIQLLRPSEPTGDLREDLRALFRPWRGPRSREEVIIAAVLSAAEWRPALHEAVHGALDQPVAEAIGHVLSRHLSDAAIVERIQELSWVLRGLILDRLLRTGARAAVDLDRLVDFLIAGLGGENPTAAPRPVRR